MKTALCLSGQMRSFYGRPQKTLERKIIRQLKPDIFISTWANSGQPTKRLGSVSEYQVTEHLLNRYYKPKHIEIETFSPDYHKNIAGMVAPDSILTPEVAGLGTLPLYYKIHKCDILRREHEKENGFQYDCVIRCRPDILLQGELNIQQPFPDHIYKVAPDPKKSKYPPPNFVWDTFFVANSPTMTKICDLFLCLNKYWYHVQDKSTLFPDNNYRPLKGSLLLTAHINTINLKQDFCGLSWELDRNATLSARVTRHTRNVKRAAKRLSNCLISKH